MNKAAGSASSAMLPDNQQQQPNTQHLESMLGITPKRARSAVKSSPWLASLTAAQIGERLRAVSHVLPAAYLQQSKLPAALAYWTKCCADDQLLSYGPNSISATLKAWSLVVPGGRPAALALLLQTPKAWRVPAGKAGLRFAALFDLIAPAVPKLDADGVVTAAVAVVRPG